MTEGEEEQQEIENLFEKIMKENFPSLAKELNIEIQEASESQRSWIQEETHRGISQLSYQKLKIRRES